MFFPSIHIPVFLICCISFLFHLRKKRVVACVMMALQAFAHLYFPAPDHQHQSHEPRTQIELIREKFVFMLVPLYYLGGVPSVSVTWWGRRAFASPWDLWAFTVNWGYGFLIVNVCETVTRGYSAFDLHPTLFGMQLLYVLSFANNA
eukprot:PhF_6_TR31745/c0_g1_i5/m.46734